MPALSTSQVWIDESWPLCGSPGPSLEQNTTQNEFDRQLALMVEQHKSYPSIVTWVSLERPSENPGQN